MFRPHRRPIEAKQPPSVLDPIDDRIGQIVVIEHRAPALRMLVRREEHRARLDVPLVDHVEQYVGGGVAVGQIADLVDDEQVRLDIARERLAQTAFAARGREIVDQIGAVVKSASKPFCSARYAMATARCVLPRPGLPPKITTPPSVMKSRLRSEPMVVKRKVDW
jgi:hypothetical protein